MRKCIFFSVTLFFLAMFHTNVIANNRVAPQMKKMAKQFSDHDISRYTHQPTLAVLPFQADKKLSERGIGIAIGEMLTSFILDTKKFKVVERAELQKVLEEQKLGLTGAIESNTAIAVGHLLGCQIVVIGNVARLGDSYQISARMIDVLMGEVLKVVFTEVDADALDQEAKKYAALVPEKEAVGIYIGYLTQFIEGKPIPYRSGSEMIISERFYFDDNYGFGVRYLPIKELLTDLLIIPSQTKNVNINYYFNSKPTSELTYKVSQGLTAKASISYLLYPTESVRFSVGTGVIYSSVTLEYNGITGFLFNTSELDLSLGGTQSTTKSFVLFTPLVGLEYRPMHRFTIAATALHVQGSLPEIDMTFKRAVPNETVTNPKAIFTLEKRQFIYSVTASLYF